MKAYFHSILSLCSLLSAYLAISQICYSIPLPTSRTVEAGENNTDKKFEPIRTTYLKVARYENKPIDGIAKLAKVFLPQAKQLSADVSITKDTKCLPPKRLSSKENQALFTAYCASFIALEARNSSWPLNKWNLAQRSLVLLDNAVKSAPLSIEIRSLRLAVSHNLPFFF